VKVYLGANETGTCIPMSTPYKDVVNQVPLTGTPYDNSISSVTVASNAQILLAAGTASNPQKVLLLDKGNHDLANYKDKNGYSINNNVSFFDFSSLSWDKEPIKFYSNRTEDNFNTSGLWFSEPAATKTVNNITSCKCNKFTAPWQWKSSGKFTKSLSCVLVAPGWEVKLYSKTNLKGTCKTITAGVHDMRNYNFDDECYSFKIVKA
jgi:hypothetical protein